MYSFKPMAMHMALVKLTGSQNTKRHECGERTCLGGELTEVSRGDGRGWVASNQNALYTCMELSKNIFN